MRVCDVACGDVNDLLTVTSNPISACQNVISIDWLILWQEGMTFSWDLACLSLWLLDLEMYMIY